MRWAHDAAIIPPQLWLIMGTMMEEQRLMTEEQVKFWFNQVFRMIDFAPNGLTFGYLIEWAAKSKLDDNTFLAILDGLETEKLVVRQGERYSAL
jgi:hypothetical protein